MGLARFEEALPTLPKGDGPELVPEDTGERCEWREGLIGGSEVPLISKRSPSPVRDCGDRERPDTRWPERVIW